jgi:hypothetical protein
MQGSTHVNNLRATKVLKEAQANFHDGLNASQNTGSFKMAKSTDKS